MAEYHATWQASTTYNKLYEDPRSKYFLFSEDRMRVWVQGKFTKNLLHRF